jgi:hypothetical protein
MGEDPRDAGWITALFAISPTFAFHSISFYPHLGVLLFFLLALVQIDGWKSERGPFLRRPLLFGAVLGLGFGIRTYTIFLLCIPFAFVLNRRDLARAAAGVALGLSFIALLNFAVWGHPVDSHFIQNIRFRMDGEGLGGWDAATRLSDMVVDGIRWTLGRGPWDPRTLKFPLSGAFPWGATLLTGGLLAVVLKNRGNNKKADWFLISVMVALVAGHFSFDNSPTGRFGERYFFEVHFVWVILAWRFLKSYAGRRAAFSLIAASMLLALYGTAAFFRADNLRRMDPFLKEKALGPGPRIVFMRDAPDFDPPWYARNQPDLSGTIFVRDLGPRNSELLALYPRVPAFRYDRSAAGDNLSKF